jgi:hypothetical protein
VLWDIFKNNSATITPSYEDLKAGLQSNKINTPIKFAAEYFLDYHVDELIEDEIPLLAHQGQPGTRRIFFCKRTL